MIYDCFTFFNELELLDIRLHELNGVVDKFILVEGSVTFTNKKKKLYFKENKDKFKRFEKKIIHIVVKDSPSSDNPWDIERFQFNAIGRGLKKAELNDIILLSCVDEIPKAETVFKWKDKDINKTKVFLQRLHYYFLNYVRADKNYWEGTKMLSFASAKKYKNFYEIRKLKAKIFIQDGGWHFSYMGGVERIKEKISAFSHTQYNNDKYNNTLHISKSLREKSNLLDDFILFRVENPKNLPVYVQNNKSKFVALMSDEKSTMLDEIKIGFKKLLFLLSL